jgi:(2Fe-2S) ferredoxin
MAFYRAHVLVCKGTGCNASGSSSVFDALGEEIRKRGLDQEVALVETGCHGMCEMGPIVVIYPEGSLYCRVSVDDVPEIVEEHLYKGAWSSVFFTPPRQEGQGPPLQGHPLLQQTASYRAAKLRLHQS